MKLLARILSHGFAIAVVLLLAIGLIYRGELFPEYDLPGFLNIERLADSREESTTGEVVRDAAEDRNEAADQDITSAGSGAGDVDAGVDAAAPEPTPVEADATALEPAALEAVEPVPVIEPEVPPAPAEYVDETTEAEPATEPATPVPEESMQQPGEEVHRGCCSRDGSSKPTAEADTVVPESLPEDSAVTTDAVAMQPEPDAVTPPDAVSAESPAQPQEKAYQLLAAAREAYWLRDYDIAESKYLALTQLEPDNPDGYGELGNMYFSQGKWDQAASVYYAAGVRLVGQGLLEQAEELISVIRGLNGANADELERQIAAARSAAD